MEKFFFENLQVNPFLFNCVIITHYLLKSQKNA